MAHDDTAEDVIAALGLQPHPEGGWYAETYRPEARPGERPPVTSILFLLAAGEQSHWHRVDASEIWHHHAGAALELRIAETADGPVAVHRLGMDLAAGERPQAVVPPGAWQSARSLGPWTLVGCSVAPGFEFTGFELASPGWEPEMRRAARQTR